VHSAWAPIQGILLSVYCRRVFRIACVSVLLGQTVWAPAHSANPVQAYSTIPDATSDATAHPPGATQASGPGLQLLDPAATSESEDGFMSDFRRWADILVGDYQTFLPMIVMFATIGAVALVFAIRRRRLSPKGRFRADPRDIVRRRTARGGAQTRTTTNQRNPPNMARTSDRSGLGSRPLLP
jgi:hypothetical protein